MTREEAFKLTPEKAYIMYAKGKYRVASVFEEFGVTWIEIYDEPPSLHIDRIQAGSCSLPPAEGAEEILDKYKRLFAKGQIWILRDDAIKAMTEFAAQQQPTAEGAEEILTNFLDCEGFDIPEDAIPIIVKAMNHNITLHAQKIADKMVNERDDDVFDKMNCLIGYLERWLNNPQSNNPPAELKLVIDEAIEYLKSREK